MPLKKQDIEKLNSICPVFSSLNIGDEINKGSKVATSLLNSEDAPNSYEGQSGKLLAVKATEDGLEFIEAGGGGGTFQEIYNAEPDTIRSINVDDKSIEFNLGEDNDIDRKIYFKKTIYGATSEISIEQGASGGNGIQFKIFNNSGNGITLSEQEIEFINSGGQITNSGNTISLYSAGITICSNDTQKLAFWGATPVVQQVLATGAEASVDDVISLLQTIGLCKQA